MFRRDPNLGRIEKPSELSSVLGLDISTNSNKFLPLEEISNLFRGFGDQ